MGAQQSREHYKRFGVVALAAITVVLAAAGGSGLRQTVAQQNPLCGALYGTEDPRRDAALDVALDATAVVRTVEDDEARGRRPVDELTVSWTVDLRAAGLKCIWVGLGTPEEPENSIAEFILEPHQRSFTVRPTVATDRRPARVCYRLIPMSATGAGRATGVCAEIENPRGPVIPGESGGTPGAPAVGTGLISDEGSGVWVVGFAVVTGTIVLVLVVSGGLRRRRGG